MASKTAIENVSAELLKDGKKVYDVKLRLTIKELMVDERSVAAAQAIAQSELMTPGIADGRYTLRFSLRQKKRKGGASGSYIEGGDDVGWLKIGGAGGRVMAKFNLKDRVKRKGVDEVRTVEEIRDSDIPGREPKYWLQLGSDFATRVWADESELEPVG